MTEEFNRLLEEAKQRREAQEAYDKTLLGYIEQVSNRASKATPGPWGPYHANIPFDAVVTKPAPSLSKHDTKRNNLWRFEDALFISWAQQDVTKLISIVKLFTDYLTESAEHDTKNGFPNTKAAQLLEQANELVRQK